MTWSRTDGQKTRSRIPAYLLGIALLASSLFHTAPAAAVGNEETGATGKGIVGGALVGGETVMLVEALIGVKPWWAYAIGGGAGAVGGGIGGFFLADAGTGAAPMALLTAGLVLTIPTTLAVLSATAYQPPEPEDGSTAARRAQAARLRLQPPSLLSFSEAGTFGLGIPAVTVSDVYTMRQRLTFGLPAETEVRVPLLEMQF